MRRGPLPSRTIVLMRFSETESQLMQALALKHRPVAITFVEEAPNDVPAFTGQVPSGCTFWQLASEGRPFFTQQADHYNCAIGCHTHNIPLPPEREQELMATVGFMVETGYIKMNDVPGIARLTSSPKHVIYSPLGESKKTPDVVIVRGAPGKLMLLQEAGLRAGAKVESPLLARPTCMAIPAAMSHGTTMSTGCIGNRVYTHLDDSELYVMVPGADIVRIAEQLETILSANVTLAQYHEKRRNELLRA